MDDYLTKPFALSQLLETLNRWAPIPASTDPVDLSLIASTWGGDAQTVSHILGEFQRANEQDAITFRQSVAARDMAAAYRSAHRMVGASKMIGAEDFATICEHLGRVCRADDTKSVNEDMSAFEHEYSRLNAYIDAKLGRPLKLPPHQADVVA